MKIQTVISAVLSLIASAALAASSPPVDRWAGEGDAMDLLGGNTGMYTNLDLAGGSVMSFDTGQVGLAFSLSGQGAIDCGPGVANFGTGEFTVSFWLKTVESGSFQAARYVTNYFDLLGNPLDTPPDDGTPYTNQVYVVYDAPGVRQCINGPGFSAYLDEGRVTFAVTNADASVDDVTSREVINDGMFHYIGLVRSGADIFIYVDGVMSGKASGGSPVSVGNGDFMIGQWFLGLLDEVEVYSYARSPNDFFMTVHPSAQLLILQQPLGAQALVGRQIAMGVGVVGVEPFSFQWQLNGLDVPGAVSALYELNNPQTNDAGTYTVVICNSTGCATSSNAVVNVRNSSTPSDALIARWSSEGNANDNIGGHTGLARNMTYAPGVVGNAFQFDGINSYINCGDVFSRMGTQNFTIDFWMRTTFTNRAEVIMGQRPACFWPQLMFHYLGNTLHTVNFTIGEDDLDVAQPNSHASQVILNDGVFHHVAAVRDGLKSMMYVDGLLADTAYASRPVDLNSRWAAPFLIGTSPCVGVDGTQRFRGRLDEIEIHSRALSATEIYRLYQPDPSLTILEPPQRQSAVEGSSVTLKVTVTGQEPYAFQWQFNGVDLPGATDSAYLLSAVQMSDAGAYSVGVSNPLGSAQSQGAELTVIPGGANLPGLVNKWSAEGNTEDLMRNSSLTSFDVNFASGVSGQAFDMHGSYEYAVFDSNTGNFGTNDFTMDLWLRQSAPGIVLAKHGAWVWQAWGTLNFGSTANILSTPPLTLEDGMFHHAAVTRRLVTTNVTTTINITNITLVSSNAFGTNFTHIYNTNITTSVVTGDQYADTYTIYFDGVPAAQTVVSNLLNYTTDYDFEIGDDWGRSQRFNGQMDEIEVYNRALSDSEIAGIYARSANSPRVDGQKQYLSMLLGDSTNLSLGTLISSGPPGTPVSYQWQLNGVNIAGATDSTLAVNNLQSSGAGFYTLVVSNAYGSTASAVALIGIRPAPGTYNGLFYVDNSPTDDSSGFITLTLDRNLVYSGHVSQSGTNYSFSGKFSGGRTVIPSIARQGKTPMSISLASLSDNNFSRMRGLVRVSGRTVPLMAERGVYSTANPSSQAGTYTLSLKGLKSAVAPNGNGFGNVTIGPGGTIALAAVLGDNTPITQGVKVANSGVWPLYVPLYAGKGSLLGWLSFTNTTESRCAGNLRWVKASAPKSTSYTNGFASLVPVMGSSFKARSTGLGVSLTNRAIVFEGAKLFTAVSDPIMGTNRNTITFNQSGNGGTNKSTLTVTPGSGRFSGTFRDPSTGSAATIKGVVLQDQTLGAGFFISSNLSGQVLIK